MIDWTRLQTWFSCPKHMGEKPSVLKRRVTDLANFSVGTKFPSHWFVTRWLDSFSSPKRIYSSSRDLLIRRLYKNCLFYFINLFNYVILAIEGTIEFRNVTSSVYFDPTSKERWFEVLYLVTLRLRTKCCTTLPYCHILFVLAIRCTNAWNIQ